ncbi:hypothetical protein [Enterococcus sp. LJL51]|uniref:hypothetical protein n=1 Tax=Enterococcus sp. LJL51 TaxID=3416656 RepID=UPI003CE6EE50
MSAIIDNDEVTDFTRPSDEKWAFALTLIDTINEALEAVPKTLFTKQGYEKENVIFSVTMSDATTWMRCLLALLKK